MTTNSRFHNFGFQELSNKLFFRTEQLMSTNKHLRKLETKNLSFLVRKWRIFELAFELAFGFIVGSADIGSAEALPILCVRYFR